MYYYYYYYYYYYTVRSTVVNYTPSYCTYLIMFEQLSHEEQPTEPKERALQKIKYTHQLKTLIYLISCPCCSPVW